VFEEVLLGETIRLQPVVLDEAEEWLAGEDDEQLRWFEAPGPAPLSNVVRAITEWQASWEAHGGIRHWGVRPVDSDTILGGVELRQLGNQQVNLSYLVFPPYRHRGIAVQASKLAIAYAAREMGAKRVIVKMLQDHGVSLAVARRLGAKPVGTGPSDAGRTFLINVIEMSRPDQPRHIATRLNDVWLNPMTSGDAADLVKLYRQNVEHLTRYGDYQEQVQATEADVREELSHLDSRLCWRIVVEGRFVGRAELVAVDPPKYGLGYLLDMNECGRGVATEAVRSLVEYAFDSLGATDVFAGVTHGNERSVTLLQRLGFDRVAQFESYDRFHLGATG
jgi:RimJ/RimL family protein N-acetyltransferase